MVAMKDVDIGRFLAERGLLHDAAATARQLLEDHGLTRISVAKLPQVEALLNERLVCSCHKAECREFALTTAQASRGTAIQVAPPYCAFCGGSDNRRAVAELAKTMEATGRRRLLVVGGAPGTQQTLMSLLPSTCSVRFVSRDESHSAKSAGENRQWADIVVIWASTPIGHKTTNHYKGSDTITVARRGVSALASDVAAALGGLS